MATNLIHEFQTRMVKEKTSIVEMFRNLKTFPDNHAINELCIWIIENYLKILDPLAIRLAIYELIPRRPNKYLSLLSEIRIHLEKQDPEFRIYREDLDFLLAILQNAQNGAICNCAVYQDSTYNVPPYQVDLEELSRSTVDLGQGYGETIINVRCKNCGKLWEVSIDESYHYPHSHWRETCLKKS